MCKKILSGLFGGGKQEEAKTPAVEVSTDGTARKDEANVKANASTDANVPTTSGIAIKDDKRRGRVPGLAL